MSFGNKGRDSKDTAKLRAEYESKARQFREAVDPASRAKLRDDKQKAFQRVVDQVSAERRDKLAETHKVLIGMGKLKSKEQMEAERAKIDAANRERVSRENR